jgi:hypothetical protein
MGTTPKRGKNNSFPSYQTKKRKAAIMKKEKLMGTTHSEKNKLSSPNNLAAAHVIISLQLPP